MAAKARVAELRKGSFQNLSQDIERKMKAAQAARKTVDMSDWNEFLPELKKMNEKEIKGETALVVCVQQIAEEANRTLEQSSANGGC